MKTVNIRVRFAFYDSDSYGWDYGDNHVQPYAIEVEGLKDNELQVIEPYNQKEIANIYRYVCYRLKLDNLSKKDFVRGFIATIRKLEEEFNKKYLEVKELSVYGVCTVDQPLFTPRNYEFIERIEVKRMGKLVNNEPVRLKGIKSNLHSLYIDKPLIVTDNEDKGISRGPDHYFPKYKLPEGDYSIYQLLNANNEVVASCILKSDVDFYAVQWEDQYGFNHKREGNAVTIICTEKAVTKGLIENINQLDDIETDGQNYIAFPVKMELCPKETYIGPQYASYYLAKFNGKTVGIGVDSVGYYAGTRKTIHELINELT